MNERNTEKIFAIQRENDDDFLCRETGKYLHFIFCLSLESAKLFTQKDAIKIANARNKIAERKGISKIRVIDTRSGVPLDLNQTHLERNQCQSRKLF